MFKSLKKDIDAFMPISIIMISIIVVSVILLILMVSMTQHHPLQTKTTIESIVSSLYQNIQSVDSSWIETHKTVYLNDLSLPCSIQLFSDSIKISAIDSSHHSSVIKKSVISWWIHSNDSFWKNSTSFHQYVQSTYGYNGTILDPICNNTHIIKNQLDQLRTYDLRERMIKPYIVDMSQPIHIEKIIIYLQDTSDSVEDVLSISYVLLYQ